MVAPMPPEKRTRIHDRVLALRVAPWKPSLEEIARAIADDWPGVTADQVRGVVAGLASKERAVLAAVASKTTLRTARRESG